MASYLLFICIISNDIIEMLGCFLAMNQVRGMNELFLVKNS